MWVVLKAGIDEQVFDEQAFDDVSNGMRTPSSGSGVGDPTRTMMAVMTPEGYTVQLQIPASTELLHLVRAAAGAIAVTAGFSIDDIDDLRIAADEGAVLLMQTHPEANITMGFRYGLDERGGRFVEIEGWSTGKSVAALDDVKANLAKQILQMVTDEHHLEFDDSGGLCVRFLKRSVSG